MKRIYGNDKIDGKEVPPLVVTSDFTLEGIHQGTVHVEFGTLHLNGILQGTLDVHTGAKVNIIGEQQGTVVISSGASVTVIGTINGTVSLENGAFLLIEESGKLGGTLLNDGSVILRGVFGGGHSGQGQLLIEGNGYIKNPVIRNGIRYYEW
jgi:hypothetical protein